MMRWTVHVARMAKMTYNILAGKPEGRSRYRR